MLVLYDDINVKGHLNMMQASRQNNVKKFVYAVSAVYGDDRILSKQEGSEGNIISLYALIKRINEEYVDLYYILCEL